MREYLRVYTTRQACALAVAGALALPLYLVTALAFPSPEIRGPAHVIDGDTIEISGARIRLEGIDAPEMNQTCTSASKRVWRCGAAAARALRAMVAGRDVVCQKKGSDAYGRILARCSVDIVDINAQLVRSGHAWAFVLYSKSYISQEALARSQKVGIWQTPTQPAWEFRRRRWRHESFSAPKGCAIKGNISRNGRVYHMPWSRYYDRVRIDTRHGERWFCDEKTAVAAGWRPAKSN